MKLKRKEPGVEFGALIKCHHSQYNAGLLAEQVQRYFDHIVSTRNNLSAAHFGTHLSH